MVGGLLGQGNQGSVWKALDTRTGKFVAIKEISLGLGTVGVVEDIDKIKKEIEILQRLTHRNVIQYIECMKRANLVYIVFEYIENGSLKDIVRKFGQFTEPLAVSRKTNKHDFGVDG